MRARGFLWFLKRLTAYSSSLSAPDSKRNRYSSWLTTSWGSSTGVLPSMMPWMSVMLRRLPSHLQRRLQTVNMQRHIQ